MTVVQLQLLAALLLIFWVSIFYRTLKSQKSSNTVISIHSAKPTQSNKEKINTSYSFNYWEEVITQESVKGTAILENMKWKSDKKAYHFFLESCKNFMFAIVSTGELNWLSKKQELLFDDPAHMPLLWENGYSIKVVKGRTLIQLLEDVDPFSLIVISIKDDGTQSLNHKWQEKLAAYGMHSLTREYLRNSYINLIWKKSDALYISLHEEVSEEAISLHLKQGDKIKNYTMPFDLNVTSKGLMVGNFSSIIIDGTETSPNLRGLNIVIYNLLDKRIEKVHRVDTFVSIYEDTTIYHAISEVEEIE